MRSGIDQPIHYAATAIVMHTVCWSPITVDGKLLLKANDCRAHRNTVLGARFEVGCMFTLLTTRVEGCLTWSFESTEQRLLQAGIAYRNTGLYKYCDSLALCASVFSSFLFLFFFGREAGRRHRRFGKQDTVRIVL